MQTGENEQGLRKIMDLTRIISITVLLIHFYYYCYEAFCYWDLHSTMTDSILQNIYNTGLFKNFQNSKLIALAFLVISLLGARGKKSEKLDYKTAFLYSVLGWGIYFFSYAILLVKMNTVLISSMYIGVCSIGFILILTGGTYLTRIIHQKLNKNVFNSQNETFPQEERLIAMNTPSICQPGII